MNLSDTPNGPAYPSRESGWRTRPPLGLPVLQSSSYADMPSPLPRRDRRRDGLLPGKRRRRPSPYVRWVGSRYTLEDQLSSATCDWKGDDLQRSGLFLDMAPWQACVFELKSSP